MHRHLEILEGRCVGQACVPLWVHAWSISLCPQHDTAAQVPVGCREACLLFAVGARINAADDGGGISILNVSIWRVNPGSIVCDLGVLQTSLPEQRGDQQPIVLVAGHPHRSET